MRNKITVWVYALMFLSVAGLVYATVISDTEVSSNKINNILYVQPNNATDIQTRINQCPASGCTVVIPCGVYNLNYIANISSNTTIRGEGMCSLINATTGNYFSTAANNYNIEVRELHFKGSNRFIEFVTNEALNTTQSRNFIIKNNFVEDVNGLAINILSQSAEISGNTLINVSSGIGIQRLSTLSSPYSNFIISGNRITQGTFTSTGEGIDLNTHDNSNAIITDNYVEGFLQNGIESNSEKVTISNNIVILPTTGNPVNGNHYPWGISVYNIATDGAVGIISNNVIANISYNGTGIYVSNSGTLSIIGNQLIGINKSTGGLGMELQGNDIIVMGNLIKDVNVSIDVSYMPEGKGIYEGNVFKDVNTELQSNGQNYSYNIGESGFVINENISFGLGYGINASSIFNPPWATSSSTAWTNTSSIINTSLNVSIGYYKAFAPLNVHTAIANQTIIDISSSKVDVVGNYVGVRMGYQGSTDAYMKGAWYFVGRSGNAVGDFIWALNTVESSSNVNISDARMTLKSYGNLGLGTTSPLFKLHIVATDAENYGGLRIDQGDTGSSRGLFINSSSSGEGILVDGSGTGYSAVFNNGNVCINSTNCTSGLSVVGNANISGTIYNNLGSHSGFVCYNATNTALYVSNTTCLLS